MKPELYLYSFVLQAMARHGMTRKALEIIRRYWGRILDSGYPTVFEAGVHQFGREAFGKDFRKPERRDFIPVSSADKRIFVEYADAMQSAVRK